MGKVSGSITINGGKITATASDGAGIGGIGQSGSTTVPSSGSIPEVWQCQTVFSGLMSDTAYTFYARYAGNEYCAPAVSTAGTTASTLSTTQTNTVGAGENIILEDGTQISNDGEQVTVSKDKNTVVIKPAPAGSALVDQSGSVTLPSGGSATVTDDNGNTITIAMPEGGGTIAPMRPAAHLIPLKS